MEATQQTQNSIRFASLTDAQLYGQAKKYGADARIARRQFAGLLPEIYSRGLYKRRGFASIYEFSFKLAGMSQRSVDKVISLSRRLEEMPSVRKQLESGEQGWSKIEIVASVVTPETDKEWAEKVERLSFRALSAYVIEHKRAISHQESGGDLTKGGEEAWLTGAGQLENKFEWSQMSFKIKRRVDYKIRELKLKLEKERGEALTFNEVIEHLLEKQMGKKTVTILQVCPECAKKKGREANTRHIPAQVRRLLQAKYEGKCAFKVCNKPATNLHHTKRFALEKNHDPDFIVPLCTEHERFVHSGLIVNEEAPPEEWQIQGRPRFTDKKFAIDQKVQAYRTERT